MQNLASFFRTTIIFLSIILFIGIWKDVFPLKPARAADLEFDTGNYYAQYVETFGGVTFAQRISPLVNKLHATSKVLSYKHNKSKVLKNYEIKKLEINNYNTKTDCSLHNYLSEVKFEGDFAETEKCQYVTQLKRVLEKFPNELYRTLGKVTLQKGKQGSRGLANAYQVILRVDEISSEEEFTAVFIHELGHVIDGGLRGTSNVESAFKDGSTVLPIDDPSVEFYALSWEDSTTRKNVDMAEFVSRYATQDPFEDFAETLIYYVLHGKTFKSIARDNNTLLKKYSFIKNTVFNGMEFESGSEASEYLHTHYDTTILTYDEDAFYSLPRAS